VRWRPAGDVLLAQPGDAVHDRPPRSPARTAVTARDVDGRKLMPRDAPEGGARRASGKRVRRGVEDSSEHLLTRRRWGAGHLKDPAGDTFEPARADEMSDRLAVEAECGEVLDEDEAVLSPAALMDGVEDGHRRTMQTGCDN
jgi:hypothetical protein